MIVVTRFIKHLLLLFLVLSFVPLLPFTGFSQSPNPVKNNASFVIKPGHEPEILAVFNNPQHFSPFKLKNISIQNDSIMLGYSSPDGSILEFELVHPSTVGRSLSKSDEFVIIPKSESPNSTLLISKIQGALAGAKKLDLWNSATFGIPETTGFTDFVFNNSLILLWFALFLLMVLSWPTIEGFGLFPALSLFILSWALRKWFGLVSPGNWDIILTLYGQASVSIFSLLAFLDRLTPANLIAVARILGALAPVFVAMAAYELKPSRTYALTAGVLLSMQPLLIRFSSDCERQR